MVKAIHLATVYLLSSIIHDAVVGRTSFLSIHREKTERLQKNMKI